VFVFLVTGPSGAGKSTLARRMATWGHHTLSADADPALSTWTDHAGHRVDRPAHPTADWLANHQWRWDPDRLDAHIADAAGTDATALWIFGRADNALTMLDRFDAVFLLDIDPTTAAARICNPSRGNDYGRVGDSLTTATETIAEFRTLWLARGATPVDAQPPLDTVGHSLLTEAAMAVLRLRR
jgi:energy-coupling factor transporter ATP-binding protein EcfA2